MIEGVKEVERSMGRGSEDRDEAIGRGRRVWRREEACCILVKGRNERGNGGGRV